jgi:dimethylhistidine N-methyltransferase
MRRAGTRVSVRPIDAAAENEAFAADVRFYLSQRPRQLPSRYLYDELGSALFDAICRLPWYHVTRAEMRLLKAHAADILRTPEPPARLVELGSGSGEKLSALVSAGMPSTGRLDVHLVDVSGAALATAARALSVFESVHIVTHQAQYEAGLADAARESGAQGRTLALFLGSNIGNFDPAGAERFLQRVHDSLRPGDGLLLGADLVKSEQALMLAYDDPLGVTAAFNLNLLARINRELDGNIDLAAFRHQAVWNTAASRIEMHLVSTRPQKIRIRRAQVEVTLREGESIWTESSYKYEPDGVAALLARCGFDVHAQWTDEARFALTLAGIRQTA